MRILMEMWEYRSVIGFGILVLIAYFGWQEFKKARASGQESNRAFLAQTKVLPTEDVPELGAEGLLRSELFKK